MLGSYARYPDIGTFTAKTKIGLERSAAEARMRPAGLIFCLTKGDLPLPVPPKRDWQASADTADEERGAAEVEEKALVA
jgi:hypothetical protein